jgi:hypothetical protein
MPFAHRFPHTLAVEFRYLRVFRVCETLNHRHPKATIATATIDSTAPQQAERAPTQEVPAIAWPARTLRSTETPPGKDVHRLGASVHHFIVQQTGQLVATVSKNLSLPEVQSRASLQRTLAHAQFLCVCLSPLNGSVAVGAVVCEGSCQIRCRLLLPGATCPATGNMPSPETGATPEDAPCA